MLKNILFLLVLLALSVSSASAVEMKTFNGVVAERRMDRITLQLLDDLSNAKSFNGRTESFNINETTKCIFRRDNYKCSKIRNRFVVTAVVKDNSALKIVIREAIK